MVVMFALKKIPLTLRQSWNQARFDITPAIACTAQLFDKNVLRTVTYRTVATSVLNELFPLIGVKK
ncbi:hypothetical protein SAMN05216213_10665 [Ectopseudomonas guguanensis]|uniref:Uncharacterized protein n=1 Tax=Ectopseudomonas guguanensis TaxID=1198456 RepID=A0A1H0VU41_9GAMM|nr:hypothetical protein SAMN05216213_10665 [Pseudomonas guguanensis]